MKKIKSNIPLMLIAFGILFVTCMESCKRQYLNYSTNTTVNMLGYMQQNEGEFSLFTQIVEKAGYSSFLNAYGAYTLFLPTNDAVNAYLKKISKASVNDIDVATAKNLVSFAIIQDTIATNNFTDGKIRTPTMINQYLITGAANESGTSSITINKQAKLTRGNIRLGNGIVHVIDNVLVPASLTLAQMIEQDPRYSIFSEALKVTGFYDTLNTPSVANTQINRKFLTVIAQTNDAFSAAGIPSFTALRQKYSNTGNPKTPTDGLYLFVAYRIWPELAYLSDIAVITSHSTLAPQEVTTSQLEGQSVLLNNNVFNGVLEPGVALDRVQSDFSSNNGVLHTVSTNYDIKVRLPSPLYMDLGDITEVKRTPGLYRAPSKNQMLLAGSLADVTWTYTGGTGASAVGYYIMYRTTAAIPGAGDWYYGNDWIEPGGRFRTGTNGLSSISYRTPLLVKGRYKVWLDYKRGSQSNPIIISVDGQALPNIINTNDAINDAESDALLESKGYKRYSESPLNTTTTTSGGNGHVGRLAGTINILTTDRHTVTMSTTSSGGNGAQQWDVVEFRPIDMNQVYPKLGRDGKLKF
jgi:uncharacterized surface protein with fasciclin (FAS1) repeats